MTNKEWREKQKCRQELFDKMAGDLMVYEKAQYRKAFLDGTDEAWKRYKANIKRRLTKIYNETGFRIDYDRFMSMV